MDYQHHLYQTVTRRTFFTKASLLYKEIFCLLCNSIPGILSLSRGEKSILSIFFKICFVVICCQWWFSKGARESFGNWCKYPNHLEKNNFRECHYFWTVLKDSAFEGNFLGLRMFWFVFLQQLSTEDSILFKANVHHNILGKIYIFSAVGDFSSVRNNLTSQSRDIFLSMTFT